MLRQNARKERTEQHIDCLHRKPCHDAPGSPALSLQRRFLRFLGPQRWLVKSRHRAVGSLSGVCCALWRIPGSRKRYTGARPSLLAGLGRRDASVSPVMLRTVFSTGHQRGFSDAVFRVRLQVSSPFAVAVTFDISCHLMRTPTQQCLLSCGIVMHDGVWRCCAVVCVLHSGMWRCCRGAVLWYAFCIVGCGGVVEVLWCGVVWCVYSPSNMRHTTPQQSTSTAHPTYDIPHHTTAPPHPIDVKHLFVKGHQQRSESRGVTLPQGEALAVT